MKTIPMNLVIDRHISNGSAAIAGSVNGDRVNLRVARGVDDGNAYVNGYLGQDEVRLTFERTVSNGYESAVGSYGKTRLSSDIRRHQPDGDTTVSQNGEQLFIDRQNRGRYVALQSPVVGGGFDRNLRDGDESGHMALGRNGFDYTLDRDTNSGNFVLKGRTDESTFQLNVRRSASDGDLSLEGTVPAGLELFPLLWEVLGDDKNIPDRNPEYPGSLMAMSMFLLS
jgi:hypothetical protein